MVLDSDDTVEIAMSRIQNRHVLVLIFSMFKRLVVCFCIALSIMVLFLGTCAVLFFQPMFVFQRPMIAEKANSENLKKHVRHLSVDFSPRMYDQVSNLTACASYIHSHFARNSKCVYRQPYVTHDGRAFENIGCSFGSGTQDCWVVGAHYDTAGLTPGADDNASGVAGLLELGRLLSNATIPPGVRIELVAYCTEEPPYFQTQDMGSFRHAQSMSNAQQRITGMIALEMIGRFSDVPHTQTYPVKLFDWVLPSRANFIAVLGRWDEHALLARIKRNMKSACVVPVYSASLPDIGLGFDLSDHASYWAHGYPAVFVTDTAFWRNFDYHDPDDTWDRLDYVRMASVIDGVFFALLSEH